MLDLKVNVFSHLSLKETLHARTFFLQPKFAGVDTSFAEFTKKIYRREVAIILSESGHFANFPYKVSSFSLFMDRFCENC